jgi:hypothetical protein
MNTAQLPKVTIEKYLLSTCLFIIDEFNDRYNGYDKDQLREISNNDYCEADIVVRLGYPFRQMANFNMQGKANDIVVKSKDFIVEVKYLRNFTSQSKYSRGNANKLTWEEIEKDFDWLRDEILAGKKGNRAFVLSWFNAVDRFSEIMQLGQGRGVYPDINRNRLALFPFLNTSGNKTKDIFYMYNVAYQELPIMIPGHHHMIHCMFLGQPTDTFHFAIYY